MTKRPLRATVAASVAGMLSLAGLGTTLFMLSIFWRSIHPILEPENRHVLTGHPEGVLLMLLAVGMVIMVALSTALSGLWAIGMWRGRSWVRPLTLLLAPMVLVYILPSLGGALLEHLIVAFFSAVGFWALWLAWGDKRTRAWLTRPHEAVPTPEQAECLLP